jgi:hypothetical protein
MGRSKGATTLKKEDRLSLVVSRISLGWPVAEIRDSLRDSEGLSKSQAERYLTEARQFFRARAHADRQLAYGEALARFDLIFRTAIEAGQFGSALAAEKEKVGLLGLTSLIYPYREEPEMKGKPSAVGAILDRMDRDQGERFITYFKNFTAILKEFSPSEQAKIQKTITDLTAPKPKATLLSVTAITAAPGIAGDAGAATPTPTAPEGPLKAPGGAPHPKQDIPEALKEQPE